MRIFLIAIIFLFFSNCSKKIIIKTINPAKNYKAEFRKIEINKFKNDTIGLKEIIKSTLSNYQINNKKFFNIIDKEKIDLILKEQKFQDSGLGKEDKNFSLILSSSLLSGKILDTNFYYSYYLKKIFDYDRCLKYKGKTCIKYAYYYKNCKVENFNLVATIDIDKITDGKNLYSKTFNKSLKNDLCYKDFISKKSGFLILGKQIANELINDIAPTYSFTQVKIIDELDSEKIDEKKFEFAIKLIQKNELDGAKEVLSKLNNVDFSYAVNYNLGLIYESKANYKMAKIYYNRAKNIMLNKNELIKEIIIANNRIEQILKNQKILKEQLNNAISNR